MMDRPLLYRVTACDSTFANPVDWYIRVPRDIPWIGVYISAVKSADNRVAHFPQAIKVAFVCDLEEAQ